MRAPQPNPYLGRQPILDRANNVVAHELLFRSEEGGGEARVRDGALATAHVIRRAFRDLGIHTVVGRTKAFINVDAEFLLSRLIETLPQDGVVLEILETVDVDEKILRRCRQLKSQGFHFALDDFFRYDETCDPLLDIADIVKIDLHKANQQSLVVLVKRLRLRSVTLLAEKVDSAECARQCLALGFDLFQGFLYGRPTVVCG